MQTTECFCYDSSAKVPAKRQCQPLDDPDKTIHRTALNVLAVAWSAAATREQQHLNTFSEQEVAGLQLGPRACMRTQPCL